MPTGDFARLRKWAEDNGRQVQVTAPESRSDGLWGVVVDVSQPVEMQATGTSADIDEAAAQVVQKLVTVGETIR